MPGVGAGHGVIALAEDNPSQLGLGDSSHSESHPKLLQRTCHLQDWRSDFGAAEAGYRAIISPIESANESIALAGDLFARAFGQNSPRILPAA